jgi:hypothetical protein
MSEYPKLGAKESECWDTILEPLHQRVADIQDEILVMHADPDFISSDAKEFLDLKKSLKWAENYLFQAKQARAYVIRFRLTEERRKNAPD